VIDRQRLRGGCLKFFPNLQSATERRRNFHFPKFKFENEPKMGRNRTPTAVLELTGAFKKHPDRKRARASEPRGSGPVGEPPERFDEELRAIWFEIADMIPAGVLAKSDRLALEIPCGLVRKVFQDSINGAELSRLNSLLARLGMTPADRSKVSVPKQPEEQDEIAALAAEVRASSVRPN
jgi:hypothetical protein